MSNFWDEMQGAFVGSSSIDDYLGGKTLQGPASRSLQELTDRHRSANAVEVNQPAGTRVSFVANLGSVLTYKDIPGDGLQGTVVSVRTAEGDATSWQGHLAVLWDDGKFRPILAEHLRLAKPSKRMARNLRIVTSDLGDLTSFFSATGSGRDDELVHKATKDLWSFRQEGENYVLERLFDTDGSPLKV